MKAEMSSRVADELIPGQKEFKVNLGGLMRPAVPPWT